MSKPRVLKEEDLNDCDLEYVKLFHHAQECGQSIINSYEEIMFKNESIYKTLTRGSRSKTFIMHILINLIGISQYSTHIKTESEAIYSLKSCLDEIENNLDSINKQLNKNLS